MDIEFKKIETNDTQRAKIHDDFPLLMLFCQLYDQEAEEVSVSKIDLYLSTISPLVMFFKKKFGHDFQVIVNTLLISNGLVVDVDEPLLSKISWMLLALAWETGGASQEIRATSIAAVAAFFMGLEIIDTDIFRSESSEKVNRTLGDIFALGSEMKQNLDGSKSEPDILFINNHEDFYVIHGKVNGKYKH